MTSPNEQQLVIKLTTFTDETAKTRQTVELPWNDLAAMLTNPPTYPSKSACPWIKLATFGDMPSAKGSYRHDANVTAIHGIELDYDGEQMPIATAADLLRQAGVAAVVYSSPSYTATKPRWRVLCPTSAALPPEAREGLVASVDALLGHVAASESYTLSQSYYFGRVAGAEYCCVSTEGMPIDTAIAFGMVPKVERQPRGKALPVGNWQPLPEDFDSVLAMKPCPAHKKQEGYEKEWLPTVLGCLNSFGPAAVPGLVRWSLDWYRQEHAGKDEATVRRIAENDITDRIQPEGNGKATWENVREARGLPRSDLSGKFGPVLPQSDAKARREQQRKESAAIGEGDEFDPFPETLTVSNMLERFVFLADGSRVMDAEHPAHVLSYADFKNQTASNVTMIPTGEYGRDGKEKSKGIPNAQLWLNHKNRQSAISTTFKAGGEFFVTDPNLRHCVNLWAGFKQGELAPHWAVEGLFVEHVRWLFGDRADDFLDWLAHIQQKPGELPHTAWLHISSHTGTGRNWLAGVMARVFAGHVAASLDLVVMLDKGFNERLSRKVLAVVDEIRTGGNDQWGHAETMKQMVTAEVRNINTKYGRQSLEFNSCRWLLFSNHRSAIPITDDDRRFEVVINDQQPQNESYYSTLYKAMNDPAFIRGVAWYLSQRDLSQFNPGRHAKKDSAKQQVIGASQSDMVTSLKEFTAKYPFELVTSSRLQAVAGVSAFGKTSTAVSRAADDAGWVRLTKQPTLPSGLRVRLYARKHVAQAWSDAINGYELQLPKCDGGGIDWAPEV